MTLYNLKKKKTVSGQPSYPQTRELFLFVRLVLAERKGASDPASLMDTEVGAMLGYDYKYTHQWRFGKKRLFDISELEELAGNADVPFDVLRKVAVGVWTADEAFAALRRIRQGKFEPVQETLDVDGIRVTVEGTLDPARREELQKALAELARQLQSTEQMADARRREVERFESFVDQMQLPRVTFYRKPKS